MRSRILSWQRQTDSQYPAITKTPRVSSQSIVQHIQFGSSRYRSSRLSLAGPSFVRSSELGFLPRDAPKIALKVALFTKQEPADEIHAELVCSTFRRRRQSSLSLSSCPCPRDDGHAMAHSSAFLRRCVIRNRNWTTTLLATALLLQRQRQLPSELEAGKLRA